jgi:hypothetical protein
MEGLGLNAGYVAWWDKVATEDARVLQILWRAGAVFHARTTQPQTLMHLETDSNLYGTTVNPYNRDVSAGGSSGGEGALIGLRGSCLGIGTDIGGKSKADGGGRYALAYTEKVASEVLQRITVSTVSNQQRSGSPQMAGRPQCRELTQS